MRFPWKTALALATCVAALTVLHLCAPGKGISPAIFAEAVKVRLIRRPPKTTPTALMAEEVSPVPPVPTAEITPKPRQASSSGFLYDASGALDGFFAKLDRMERKPDGEHITILHYGDSPTTADLVTGDLRTLLQKRFGDAGYGYLLIAKPWAWYGHRGTDLSGDGWTISTAVGKMRAERYGLGGASFQGEAGASNRIKLRNAAQTDVELSFLAQPGGGTVQVSVDDPAGDDQPVATVHTGTIMSEPAWQRIALPAGAKAVSLKAEGKVELFGETFTRRNPGVIYDSLGLNGASTTVLSRGFDARAWAAELQHQAPALVIINYGTNESSYSSFVDHQYEGELRVAIQRIRSALPSVSILIMSPMDRGERSGIDQIETMETIPKIVAIQKRVAADTHCAFFDTFNAMGGEETMSRWYNDTPRLVSADLIHPTPQGATIVAQLFFKDLMRGYERYTEQPHNRRVRP